MPATVRRRAKDLEAAHQMESRKLANWTTARAALDGVSSHTDGGLCTVALSQPPHATVSYYLKCCPP